MVAILSSTTPEQNGKHWHGDVAAGRKILRVAGDLGVVHPPLRNPIGVLAGPSCHYVSLAAGKHIVAAIVWVDLRDDGAGRTVLDHEIEDFLQEPVTQALGLATDDPILVAFLMRKSLTRRRKWRK